jgi:glycosyltransferase involved in cell wall biosynthesis
MNSFKIRDDLRIKKIINIVDNLLPLNYGLWNAAVNPSVVLEKIYGVKSECWYPDNEHNSVLPAGLKGVALISLSVSEVQKLILLENLDPSETVIMTHGTWQFPTRWGHKFATFGFRWWYTPHGMLESWSMEQKRLKKFIYFNLVEKVLIKRATVIRAVGKPEQENLKRLTDREIQLIPNGIEESLKIGDKSFNLPRRYLFLSRLNHKKGIIPLIDAWNSSSLAGNSETELFIAGPDDGELKNLEQMLSLYPNGNIKYVGAVYGDEKKQLLESSHFFLLPSLSEGFPTSVLEAMQHGAIPLITEGCNFPEAFEADMAIRIGTSIKEIKSALENSLKIEDKNLKTWSSKIREFVTDKYSLPVITKMMIDTIEPKILKL